MTSISTSSCQTSDIGIPRVDCSVGHSKESNASKAWGDAKNGDRNHVGIEHDEDEEPACSDAACAERAWVRKAANDLKTTSFDCVA